MMAFCLVVGRHGSLAGRLGLLGPVAFVGFGNRVVGQKGRGSAALQNGDLRLSFAFGGYTPYVFPRVNKSFE
jgi:hypothetical protein